MTTPALLFQVLLLFLAKLEGNSIPKSMQQNGAGLSTPSSSSSPWLQKVIMNNREWGCKRRPWICNQQQFPIQRVCCRDRCVDLTSDRYNCGSCEIRCKFNSHCCKGLCTDTNIDTSNCGQCGNRCPKGDSCFFGMCGYAQPSLPPRPPHHRHPPESQEPSSAMEE